MVENTVVHEHVRKFLKDFEEVCKKRGGFVDKGGGLDYDYVVCRFERAPTVRVYADSYVYPEKEWSLSVCIDTSCAEVRKLDELHISPTGGDIFEEKRLRGYVEFDGIDGLTGPETRLRYVFRQKDGLKEIGVFAKEDKIKVYLVQ
jgi:hypothetical protein